MPTGEDALPDFERGIVGMDRAKALLSAGLVTEADRSLIDVCAAFGRTELVQFLAEAELIRAEVALLADQAELAHTLSHQAVARLKRRHNRRAIALGELVQLRADIARGARRDRVSEKPTGWSRPSPNSGLRDQARMARLIAIEHAGADAHAVAGDAADPARTAARSPALQPSGPGQGGLRPRRYGSGSTTGDPGHGGDHRTPGPVRQSRPADLRRGYGVRPGGRWRSPRRSSMAARRPCWPGWNGLAPFPARVPEVQPPEDPMTADLLSQLRWVINSLEQGQTQGDDTDDLRRRRNQLQRTIRARSWTIQGPRAVGRDPDRRSHPGRTRSGLSGGHLRLARPVARRGADPDPELAAPLGTMSEVEQLGMRVNADFDVLAMDLVPEPCGPRPAVRWPRATGARRVDVGPARPAGRTGRPAAARQIRRAALGGAAVLLGSTADRGAVGRGLAASPGQRQPRSRPGGGDRRSRSGPGG